MKRFLKCFRIFGSGREERNQVCKNQDDQNAYVSKEFGSTLLHFVCANNIVDVVDTVIDKGINVNTIDSFGFTPLHLACEVEAIDIVKILLQRGADVNIPTRRGETPVYIASGKSNIKMVRLLLKNGADASMDTIKGDTPLSIACRYRNVELAELLLNNGGIKRTEKGVDVRPLRYACKNGDLYMAKLLIMKVPDINLEKSLHWACEGKNTHLIKELLNKGVDINSVDEIGRTPFRVACDKRMYGIAKLFVKRGANLDTIDKFGTTPLMALMLSRNDLTLIQFMDMIEVMKLLIDNFVDISILSRKKEDGLIKSLLSDSSVRVRARIALHVGDLDVLKKSLSEYYMEYKPEYNNPINKDFKNLLEVVDNLNQLDHIVSFAHKLKKSKDYIRLKKKILKLYKDNKVSEDTLRSTKNIIDTVDKFYEDVNSVANTKVIESIVLPVKRMQRKNKNQSI